MKRNRIWPAMRVDWEDTLKGLVYSAALLLAGWLIGVLYGVY